ncbi:hypothetical protein NBT05_07065 [Aquimarina sp. ERC-38]|uniref:hypothetical protein n=1 Tax=Aquimarina sp. ERC-38 TaxID=2949996 RepID=UPI0022454487|nr:hypothetical protein [Aquimarina sp. ERC-38]UZO82228.1 hypothetical protein NBT05_07065 [Aquimarina sp. ERC-38]
MNIHKTTNFKFFVLTVLIFLSQYTFSQYKEPDSYREPKKILTIKKSNSNDNVLFQKAISEVYKAGGGHVVVSSGTYTILNINLQSNVHIIFEKDVIIRPDMEKAPVHLKKGLKSGNIFQLGRKNFTENVSIRGSKKNNVRINFSEETAMLRAFNIGNCKNFKIANITIDDNKTLYSSLVLGWIGEKNGIGLIPTDGLVENFKAINANYEFGAVQAQSGLNIVFKDIESIGGVAVRLETGYKKMNDSGTGGLYDITVENLISRKGQAALLLQAHTLDHGDIVAKDISAYGSEFAVILEAAFVSRKNFDENPKKTHGTFQSVTIDKVKAVYEDGPIETKYAHLDKYPIELHPKIQVVTTNGEKQFFGPSIAAVAHLFKKDNNVKITNIKATGFTHHPDIITPENLNTKKKGIKELLSQKKPN